MSEPPRTIQKPSRNASSARLHHPLATLPWRPLRTALGRLLALARPATGRSGEVAGGGRTRLEDGRLIPAHAGLTPGRAAEGRLLSSPRLALLGGCDFGVCPSLSGGLEVGLADVVADGLVDDPQGITQGWWRRWAICGQEWGQEPVVELGVEDREAPALGGEHVGVAAGQTADEALAAQAGQVVAHLVGRVGGAEQGGDLGAKAPVGEPDHAGEQDRQGAGQGHDPGIAEAQRSGAASRLASWLCDPRKGWARKDTARA